MRNPSANLATKGNLLKTGDVAELLHVSSQTVRDWTESGKLVSVTSESGHRNYYEADVKRYLFESKGITEYVQLFSYVAIDSEGRVYLLNDIFEQTALEFKTIPFAQYWDSGYGLQKQPHQVVLQDGAASTVWENELDRSSAMLCEFKELMLIALPVIVVGLDQDEVRAEFDASMNIASDYLKANFVAKPTVKWFDADGELVQY